MELTFCSLALAATGFIWVRYSFVIKPINISLAAVSVRPFLWFGPDIRFSSLMSSILFDLLQVNFFVGSTGLGQLARIYQ
jgi:mitochondrial pyruvate carrier 2